MTRTTSMVNCWVEGCGKEMRSAGLAAHLRAHYRRGEITRDWIIVDSKHSDGYWHYRRWKKNERTV